MAAFLAGCSTAGSPVVNKTAPDVVAAQVWLLGEVHDNPAGQRQRHALLRQRVEAGWRPVLVLEQFDRENQDLLDKAQKSCLDAQCLIRVAGGGRWDWQQYYPLLQLALDYHLPLVAGNLSRADASRVVRDGMRAVFDAQSMGDYQLEQALPARLRAAQAAEIASSHCNMVPEMMVDGMVNAQVARDIWMARLIREQRPRDVVLIAGNGHVRKDIGVPYWLALLQPPLSLHSVGYAEAPVAAGQYDTVVQVAAPVRPDPCASLKQRAN
nr:ChaN family lipoprotein [Duganella fentianensis]